MLLSLLNIRANVTGTVGYITKNLIFLLKFLTQLQKNSFPINFFTAKQLIPSILTKFTTRE